MTLRFAISMLCSCLTDRTLHVAGAYDVLRQLAPLILEHQGKGDMAGVLLDDVKQLKSTD